jgi:NAD(P)-dependent dehydrogenase (short-subunit alcohol dehydrogenase family)
MIRCRLDYGKRIGHGSNIYGFGLSGDIMLDDRVIFVTNAKHFVGPSSLTVLSSYGARVICHDESFSEQENCTAFAIENPGVEIIQSSDPLGMIAEIVDRHDRIDGLVCNDVHPAVRAPVDEADENAMRLALDALVVKPYALIGAAVTEMKKHGGGKIVMVTSAAPIRGLANYSMYTTARGAGNAMVKSLSLELAPANIQINAIAPNYIETPTYFPPDLLANEAVMEKMLKNIPSKRLGQPEEVAELIAFFVSRRCGFVTGHVIPVSGGWA